MNENAAKADLTFTDFPPASREQWLALVSNVLKGSPFEQRLVSRSRDGIAISPLYARESNARTVPGRAAGAPWRIVQRIEFPDSAAANAQALHDLENGATALALVFAGTPSAYGFGLRGDDVLGRVLDGVMLDAGITIDLQAGAQTAGIARQLTEVLGQRGVPPAAADVRFGFDPLGGVASGAAATPWRDGGDRTFAATVKDLVAHGYAGPFAAADGRIVHNAGGSEAQELAWVIATALSYLRALEANGVAVDGARRVLSFRLAADADQFLTTAKFRALRKLWARVEEACGLNPEPISIMAETAWRMMTRRDPFVNMLRATVAVAAAGLGGANGIAVVPHTAAIGLPDGFARRIARNTQLILVEESNLAKVADPAAGSGALEGLTHDLCFAAWALFQEIEKAGGAAAALEQGLIQARIAAVRAEREKDVARRKEALTGTSEFPDIAEVPVEVLVPSPLVPATAGGMLPAPAALPCQRLAEPFEALRDAADRVRAQTGAQPRIFLAGLGRLADFMARATYAKNFFEAGGVVAVTSDGFPSREDMIAVFKASGARLACLCGSDEAYAAEAAGAAESLRVAGAVHVYLAGRPGELEAVLRAAGVGTFIYAGCDAVATLTAAHGILRNA